MIEQITLGKMVAGPVFGALFALVIDGSSMIPLGAAAGVILTVVMLTRRWTSMEIQLKEFHDSFEKRLSSIERKMENLPCSTRDCKTENDRGVGPHS
jgi:hypothetical protein